MGDAFHGMEEVRREKLSARWNQTLALYQDPDNRPETYEFLSDAVNDIYQVHKESSDYLSGVAQKRAPMLQRMKSIDAQIDAIRHPSFSRRLQLLFKKDRSLYAIGQVRALIREKKTEEAAVAKLTKGIEGIEEIASISNRLGFIYDAEREQLLRAQIRRY
jgi:hypothetical protein